MLLFVWLLDTGAELLSKCKVARKPVGRKRATAAFDYILYDEIEGRKSSPIHSFKLQGNIVNSTSLLFIDMPLTG